MGEHLTKFSNATAISRNKIGHSGVVSGCNSTNTVRAGRSQASHQQVMSSSNEQMGVSASGHHAQEQTSQKYANYKAVAVSHSKGTKMPRKGNSADPANDQSSKK